MGPGTGTATGAAPTVSDPAATRSRRGGTPHESIQPANARGRVVIQGSANPSSSEADRKAKYLAEARKARSEMGFFGHVDAAVRSAANTATFGYADKIAAGGDALFGSGEGSTVAERYRDNVMRQEAITQADSEVHSGATEAGDAVASMLPYERGLRVFRGGERIIRRIAGRGKGNACRRCSKKPVALLDGVKVTHDVDFELPGLPPVRMIRVYSGDLDVSGALGRNRIGVFDEAIVVQKDGALLYLMGDGLEAEFARPLPNPGEVSRNARHPYLTLAAAAGDAFEIRRSGNVIRFERFAETVWMMAGFSDPNGHAVTLTRDAEGLLTRAERTDGFAFTFENDARGLRTAVMLHAPNGERRLIAAYAYDARENMIEARNSFGRSFTYSYDEKNRFAAYDDGAGTRVAYEYDERDRVVRVRTPGGRGDHTIAYRPERRETTLTYVADGAARTFAFDENGQELRETDPLGRTRTFERDPFGELLAEIDPQGNRKGFGWDAFGSLAFFEDEEGRRTSYAHDSDGRIERRIEATGAVWEWGYDARGNLAWARDPLGHRTDVSINAAGLPVGIMRHDGLIERRDYDARHMLVRVTDFRGGVTALDRDAFGRIVARTDPLGHVTRYAYDERSGADFWTPTQVTRPDGVEISKRVSPDRATVTATDGEGRRTVYRYGAFERLTEIEDPQGGRLRFGYDAAERIVRVENQLGRVWAFDRDAAGRVIRETDFTGLSVDYAYDEADRLVEARYPDGGRTAYAHDRSGRVLREEAWGEGDIEPAVAIRWYDGRGALAAAENDAARVEFSRDALGRIVAETVGGETVASAYDCCGNRLTRSIGGRTDSYGYDPLGGVREMTFGDHAPLVFERDLMGRETRRASKAGFWLEQRWDSVGQLRAQHGGRASLPPLPGGIAFREGETSLSRAYDWTREFAPRRILDKRWGETSFAEDDVGQIAEKRHGDGATERFAYDPALNLDGSGDAATLRPWVSAPGGRVKQAFGPLGERISLIYDARHRVVERRVERDGFRPKVWRYGWDGFERLVSCTTPEGERWAYAYDPLGRRLSKTRRLSAQERAWTRSRFPHLTLASSDGSETWNAAPPPGASVLDAEPPVVGTAYRWDGDAVAEEAPLRLGGAADWSAAIRWHYEPGRFTLVAKQERGGALRYVATDHIGTPRELFDEAGDLVWAAELSAWGDPRRLWVADAANDNVSRRSSSGGRSFGALALKEEPDAVAARQVCPIRFEGQWEDEESGLSYNRFRHYDRLAGRYVSPDPIGLAGGLSPFAYANVSPAAETDPLGLAGKKTTATGESGSNYISGTKPVPGYTHVDDDAIRAAGKDAGWEPRNMGALDRDKPGSFNCCHAEQKAYMGGERDIDVSSGMCPSCQDWFGKVTRHRNDPATVTDPFKTRRFPE